MLETVKKHPYIFGGAVIAGLVLILMLRGSGGGDAVEVSQGGSVGVGNDMALANLQAQSQSNAINAQLQSEAMKYASATEIAGLSADVQLHSLDVQGALGTLNSSLSAEIRGKEIQASKEVALGNFENQQQLATINAGIQHSLIDTLSAQQTAATTQRANHITWLDQQIAAQQATVTREEAIIAANPVQWRQAFQAQGNTQAGLPYAQDLQQLNMLKAQRAAIG